MVARVPKRLAASRTIAPDGPIVNRLQRTEPAQGLAALELARPAEPMVTYHVLVTLAGSLTRMPTELEKAVYGVASVLPTTTC